jgi:hypothetical protein
MRNARHIIRIQQLLTTGFVKRKTSMSLPEHEFKIYPHNVYVNTENPKMCFCRTDIRAVSYKNRYKCKGKTLPVQTLYKPYEFPVEAPIFQENRHMKLVSLSALCTRHLDAPGNIPGTHFCYRQSRTDSHTVAGSMSVISLRIEPTTSSL